ncbi:hypothetical protein NSQ43_07315 [Sporosarcina sp. FSL W8-0480]|uniref:hypothetical protein n=1 Tax=Sporosarcina sp. FSL W8-0480 TaxID=2954701 RepID=UPI0030D802DD
MRELIRNKNYSRTAIQAVFHFIDYLLQLPEAYTKKLSNEIRPIIREETELMELYNKENASPTIKNAFDLEWERGVQQGLEQGLEKGLEQGVKKVVLEMLRKGTPTEFIAEVTHLEKEEIEKMREMLQ